MILKSNAAHFFLAAVYLAEGMPPHSSAHIFIFLTNLTFPLLSTEFRILIFHSFLSNGFVVGSGGEVELDRGEGVKIKRGHF